MNILVLDLIGLKSQANLLYLFHSIAHLYIIEALEVTYKINRKNRSVIFIAEDNKRDKL